MYDSEECYPGYTENYSLQEYEEIKDKINEKYGTNSTALQIRTEFEESFNKLFDKMIDIYPERLFDVIFVMMDCFNIKDEVKTFRYLNEENREKIRSFAIGKYHTSYYIKKEKEKMRKISEEKGETFFNHSDVSDLFEEHFTNH